MNDYTRPIAAQRVGPFGFTLIELIVSIGIISLLISITLPSLNLARERGRVAYCLANAHSINSAMAMYLSDEQGNLPWYYIHGFDRDGQYELYPGATSFTNFSWGGMLPRISRGTVDSQMTPIELRPFGRYLAPAARAFDIVKVYICPSDSSASNPDFNSGGGSSDSESGTSNWIEYGTSYSISWHWLRAYATEQLDLVNLGNRLIKFGPRMLSESRGGASGRLVWMSENHLDQLLVSATQVNGGGAGGVQGEGWH